MNALRQAWTSTVKNLGQLSGKDRLLIGSLLVVGLMALLLVAVWSGKQTMVPLLPDMGPAAQADAIESLKDADIAYTTRDGKIYVPPDKQRYALAYLHQAGKLPQDTQSLFAALASSQNWMSTSKDSDRMANAALCEVLSGTISQFKGVERATVMMEAPEPVGMGSTFRKPTASVAVKMKPGRQIDRDMVDAIAGMVCGAKAGLEMGNVRVIDQERGAQYTPRVGNGLGGSGIGGGSGGGGGDYLELISSHERYIREKVTAMVNRFDPLSIVTVSLTADNTVKRTTTKSYSKEGAGTVAVVKSETSEESRDTMNAGSGGGAAGLGSNVAASIDSGTSGGSGGSDSNKGTSNTDMVVGLGTTDEEKLSPGGMPTRVSVMVSLSREYVINYVKTRKGSVKPVDGGAAVPEEPTQAEIEAAFSDEKKRLETELGPIVQNAAIETNASNIQRVTVSMIPVAQVGMLGFGSGMGDGGAFGSMASVGGGVAGGLVGQLTAGPVVRTTFLGLLALVALGMMLLLVRKSSKPITLPSPEELAGLPPVIDAGDDIVGEADEGATAMEGIELGETQIRTKKMLESIEEMVSKNPADAAGLMNRWLNVER